MFINQESPLVREIEILCNPTSSKKNFVQAYEKVFSHCLDEGKLPSKKLQTKEGRLKEINQLFLTKKITLEEIANSKLIKKILKQDLPLVNHWIKLFFALHSFPGDRSCLLQKIKQLLSKVPEASLQDKAIQTFCHKITLSIPEKKADRQGFISSFFNYFGKKPINPSLHYLVMNLTENQISIDDKRHLLIDDEIPLSQLTDHAFEFGSNDRILIFFNYAGQLYLLMESLTQQDEETKFYCFTKEGGKLSFHCGARLEEIDSIGNKAVAKFVEKMSLGGWPFCREEIFIKSVECLTFPNRNFGFETSEEDNRKKEGFIVTLCQGEASYKMYTLGHHFIAPEIGMHRSAPTMHDITTFSDLKRNPQESLHHLEMHFLDEIPPKKIGAQTVFHEIEGHETYFEIVNYTHCSLEFNSFRELKITDEKKIETVIDFYYNQDCQIIAFNFFERLQVIKIGINERIQNLMIYSFANGVYDCIDSKIFRNVQKNAFQVACARICAKYPGREINPENVIIKDIYPVSDWFVENSIKRLSSTLGFDQGYSGSTLLVVIKYETKTFHMASNYEGDAFNSGNLDIMPYPQEILKAASFILPNSSREIIPLWKIEVLRATYGKECGAYDPQIKPPEGEDAYAFILLYEGEKHAVCVRPDGTPIEGFKRTRGDQEFFYAIRNQSTGLIEFF